MPNNHNYRFGAHGPRTIEEPEIFSRGPSGGRGPSHGHGGHRPPHHRPPHRPTHRPPHHHFRRDPPFPWWWLLPFFKR